MRLDGKSRQHLVAIGIRLHQCAIGIELLPPDQTTLTTPVNDRLKEAPEDLDAVTFPNAGHAGMVGQWLVQVVAQIPAYTQTVSSDALKLALRTHAFEEHDQLELEEHEQLA